MKNLFTLAFLCLSFFCSAQKISGFYSGTLYSDSTGMTQKYELAINEYRGKFYGYSYVTFVKKDTFYYGIRKINARIEGDSLIVEDDKIILNNFPEPPAKRVGRVITIPLNGQDSIINLSGTWKTNQTKKYYSVPGVIKLDKSSDSSRSPLIAHLKELKIIPTESVPQYAATTNDVAVTNTKEKAKETKVKVKEEKKKNEDDAVAKTEVKIKTDDKDNSNDKIKIDDNALVKTEVKIKSEEKTKTEDNAVVKTDVKIKTDENGNSNEKIKIEQKGTSDEKIKVEQKTKAEEIAKVEEKIKTEEPIRIREKTNQAEGITGEGKPGTEMITKSAPVITTPAYEQRTNKPLQVIEIQSDSLLLSFYDNGVVDGDSISVYLNGQPVITNARLKSTATKKTVYIDPVSEMSLLLVAENLGTLPPNTGLLTIRDGENTHQVYFSADLRTNAQIIIRRKQ